MTVPWNVTNVFLKTNGILIGIPKENLSINALDILLGKYRIMGASSGTPQQTREPIEFSYEHGINSIINILLIRSDP
ncbi:hypothetical protein N7501_009293 [Penicillium viridicatum]|nr:hypothetical protein N7501_009293 [Penicillium viridicatum]